MKLIRVSTNLEMTEHEFPSGTYSEQNHYLCELIGNSCAGYEHVMPRRLYTSLHMMNRPTEVPGECVSMLVDEEGLLKGNEVNPIGSYLYETDRHGHPIMGNVLFVGETWDDGIEFCGIEDSVFEELRQRLNHRIDGIKEVFRK